METKLVAVSRYTLRIRHGPIDKSRTLITVPPGTHMPVKAEFKVGNDDWLYVGTEAGDGYCRIEHNDVRNVVLHQVSLTEQVHDENTEDDSTGG